MMKGACQVMKQDVLNQIARDFFRIYKEAG